VRAESRQSKPREKRVTEIETEERERRRTTNKTEVVV